MDTERERKSPKKNKIEEVKKMTVNYEEIKRVIEERENKYFEPCIDEIGGSVYVWTEEEGFDILDYYELVYALEEIGGIAEGEEWDEEEGMVNTIVFGEGEDEYCIFIDLIGIEDSGRYNEYYYEDR